MKLISISLSLIIVTFMGCASKSIDKKKAADLKVELAISYIQEDNLPTALKELLEAVDLDPSNPVVRNNLGIVYYMREKYELAEKQFIEAVSLSPMFTEAKNNLARCQITLKKYNSALKLLKEAEADLTYTNSQYTYFNFGMLYFSQGKYELAKSYFAKTLAADRTDCLSQVYYSRSLLELGHTQIAAQQLEKAIHFCSAQNIDEAHYYSAIAYYRLNQKDKAMNRFEEVIKLFPNGKNSSNAGQMIKIIKNKNFQNRM